MNEIMLPGDQRYISGEWLFSASDRQWHQLKQPVKGLAMTTYKTHRAARRAISKAGLSDLDHEIIHTYTGRYMPVFWQKPGDDYARFSDAAGRGFTVKTGKYDHRCE